MKTLSLRFGETFAPDCGTIQAHQEVIDRMGYVWYGKGGAAVSNEKIDILKRERTQKILLIASGKQERYWAYFDEISKQIPKKGIPDYYSNKANDFKTWFKLTKIEPAPKDICSKCVVLSSGKLLTLASKHSMNPCFFIECSDE